MKVRCNLDFLSKSIDLSKAYATFGSYETLKELRTYAKNYGGKLISKQFAHWHHPMNWQCKHGHDFESPPTRIKSGKWCSHCAGNKKGTLEEAKLLAESKNGECLSDEYVNARTPLIWKCKCGHLWDAVLDSVKNKDSWCARCAAKTRGKNRLLQIEEMHLLAKKNDGECLSDEYVSAKTPLTWKCKRGHVWDATPNNVKSKSSWCQICSNESRKLTIKEIQDVAKSFGGKCLSKKYVNQTKKLKWKCRSGHIFIKSLKQVKYARRWCPDCKKR